MRVVRVLIVVVAGVLLWLLCCSTKRSDTHQAEAATYYNLRLWVDYIKICHETGTPICEQGNLDDALGLLKQKNIVERTVVRLLMDDGWGRKFRWSAVKTTSGCRITITSDGRNGIWENGAGDDIWTIIDKPEHGEINISVRPKPWWPRW